MASLHDCILRNGPLQNTFVAQCMNHQKRLPLLVGTAPCAVIVLAKAIRRENDLALLQFDSIFGNDFVQSYFDETVCVPQGEVQAEKPLSCKQLDISIDIIPCKRIYHLNFARHKG
jgi:hypothetical protein